jgi:hypothetical protein
MEVIFLFSLVIMLVKYVLSNGISQAFLPFRFVDVIVIRVLKQQWKCKIICHFVTNGEHLYAFSRQNQPFSRKWWNLNDQSSYLQSIFKYNLLGLHSRKGHDL